MILIIKNEFDGTKPKNVGPNIQTPCSFICSCVINLHHVSVLFFFFFLAVRFAMFNMF